MIFYPWIAQVLSWVVVGMILNVLYHSIKGDIAMNLNAAEQAVYDSGFNRGLVFDLFKSPTDLSDTEQVVWRCGLYAGMAEGLRCKRARWEAELNAIDLSRDGRPAVTDADREEVAAAAVAWDKLPWDDQPLEPRYNPDTTPGNTDGS
jgi:hypothetical protein